MPSGSLKWSPGGIFVSTTLPNLSFTACSSAFTEYQKIEKRVRSVDWYRDTDSRDTTIIVNVQDHGNFVFRVNHAGGYIEMTSPFSGLWKYYYDAANDRWLCNKDNHQIDELLLREVTKHLKGGFNP